MFQGDAIVFVSVLVMLMRIAFLISQSRMFELTTTPTGVMSTLLVSLYLFVSIDIAIENEIASISVGLTVLGGKDQWLE